MMDVLMLGTIAVSCILMKLFIDWCESQVDPKDKTKCR